jgi:hypothetical protein
MIVRDAGACCFRGLKALNEPLATDLPIFLTDTGYLKLDERARFRKAGDFRNWHQTDMVRRPN